MFRQCLVTYPGQSRSSEIGSYKLFSDLLKNHPEGLFRSVYFFEADKPETALEGAAKNTLPLSGPLTISHCIRRAGDMILEDCSYEGLSIFLEVDGKKLPELPPRTEVENLLKQDKTLINIDGKTFRSNTEVFGFQQVYDDTVKVIDALKAMGVPQEAMTIMATPDEITIEVHPGIFGLPDDPKLPATYRSILYKLAGLKMGDKRPVKTIDRTILVDTTEFSFKVLVPGSAHPTLHRPKVCVGPSHFAYGPAAFSDYCGKKRNLDDSLKELRSWIKFLDSPLAANPKVQESVAALTVIAAPPAPAATSAVSSTAGISPKSEGGFQPLKQEILEALASYPQANPPLSANLPELNKSLGGGWTQKGVHIVVSGRDEGKTAFLMGQALQLAAKNGVLFVSREMRFQEMVSRVAAYTAKASLTDLCSKAGFQGPEGETSREKLRAVLKTTAGTLPETFFFRGAESSVNPYSVDELMELLKLIPAGQGKILFVDALSQESLNAVPNYVEVLRQKANSFGFTAIVSIHTPSMPIQKPHLIEGPDFDLLQKYSIHADALISLNTERVNLKKFLVISQGKVDPAVAEKLEQRLYQATGGGRVRGDAFTFVRVLHSRFGVRQAILYLFQRETNRFWEGPPLPLGRP